VSFRIHEEDEEPFECDPATVHSHKLPADGVEGNGVDIVREEETDLPEYLLHTDSTSSDVIWEEFDEES
jgi:hypothetical protein